MVIVIKYLFMTFVIQKIIVQFFQKDFPQIASFHQFIAVNFLQKNFPLLSPLKDLRKFNPKLIKEIFEKLTNQATDS